MATKYFMAGLSNNWSDTSNWSTTGTSGPNNTSPAGAADTAIWQQDANKLIVDVPTTCANFTILHPSFDLATLNINGLLTVTNTLTLPDANVVFAGSAGFTVGTLLDTAITVSRSRKFLGSLEWNDYNSTNGPNDFILTGADRIATKDTNNSGDTQILSAIGHSSGKHYCEIIVDNKSPSSSSPALGLARRAQGTGPSSPEAWYYRCTGTGFVYLGGGGTSVGVLLVNGDRIAIALDSNTGNLWLGYILSGGSTVTWFTGNPSTGASPIATGIFGTLYPTLSTAWYFVTEQQTVCTLCQSLSTFAATPPTGFSEWMISSGPVYTVTSSFIATHSLAPTVRFIYNGLPVGYAYFNLQAGATQDVGFTDPTHMNSLGGQPIFTYHGIIVDSPNWFNTPEGFVEAEPDHIQARGWAG